MAIAFVVTGYFVVSAFAMLLLTFMTDFAKITLATDHVRSSRKPETWKIGGFITVSVVLGIAMVVEALLFLILCWSNYGFAPIEGIKDKPLHTFSFLILLFFAVFSVLSARERRWFWATMPSKSLIAALTAEIVVGTFLSLVGLQGLAPLPLNQTLAILCYPIFSCLVVNDAIKVTMIKRLIPSAVA